VVYAAIARGRTLTLRVSGLLWNRSLVMEDMETHSEWSHILGECMKGKFKGAKLTKIPSEMVTWGDWLARHPKTTVLNMRRTSRAYGAHYYRDRSRFVLGLVIGGTAKAWPFDVLTRERIILDVLSGVPLLITYDNKSTRATVFSRMFEREIPEKETTEKVTLFFYYDPDTGALKDKLTHSTWDPAAGKAIAGKLKGTQLAVLPGVVSYRQAWRIFHPASGIAQ